MSNGINITSNILEKHNVSFQEAVVLLALYYHVDLDKTVPILLEKGYVSRKYFMTKPTNELFIMDKGVAVLEDLTLESDKDVPALDRLKALAVKLQVIYPEGKKQGTNYYWRGNVPDIVKKLQSFFKKYGSNYTDEQLVDATTRYMQSFKNDITYMQLLKYFIWKKSPDKGDEVSELMNYIENAGAVENRLDQNWTSKLK
jgi:hypothetical protein